MYPQYKYKGDNRYLSFQERLFRFDQSKINRIIESASDELINRDMVDFYGNNLLLPTLKKKTLSLRILKRILSMRNLKRTLITMKPKDNVINEDPQELQETQTAWKRGDAIFSEQELIWSLLGEFRKILIKIKQKIT